MAVVAAERFDARNIRTLTSVVQGELERRILTGEIEAGYACPRLRWPRRPA